MCNLMNLQVIFTPNLDNEKMNFLGTLVSDKDNRKLHNSEITSLCMFASNGTNFCVYLQWK